MRSLCLVLAVIIAWQADSASKLLVPGNVWIAVLTKAFMLGVAFRLYAYYRMAWIAPKIDHLSNVIQRRYCDPKKDDSRSM